MDGWLPSGRFSDKHTGHISLKHHLVDGPGKNKLHELRWVQFFFLLFFSPNLDSWTCKWEITSKMTWEKECILVQYLTYTVLSQFQICHNIRAFFSPNRYSKNSEFTTKMFFSKSARRLFWLLNSIHLGIIYVQ